MAAIAPTTTLATTTPMLPQQFKPAGCLAYSSNIELELADDGHGPAFRLREQTQPDTDAQPDTPQQRIVQALAEAVQPLSQRQIRRRAQTGPATVTAALHKLIEHGRVQRLPKGGLLIQGDWGDPRGVPRRRPTQPGRVARRGRALGARIRVGRRRVGRRTTRPIAGV